MDKKYHYRSRFNRYIIGRFQFSEPSQPGAVGSTAEITTIPLPRYNSEEAAESENGSRIGQQKKGSCNNADSSALFFNARQGTNSQITIQNNLAEITVDTKGGRIFSHAEGIHGTRQNDPDCHTVQRQ